MQASIIIPTFNEEKNIAQTLGELARFSNIEIIIADGGSTDKTEQEVKEFRATQKIKNKELQNTIRFINTPQKGRANQMNTGAHFATSNTLIFLHADTLPPKNFITDIQETLKKNDGGGHLLYFNSKNPLIKINQLLANTRARTTKIFYGDQCIFCTKEIFQKIKGFKNIPYFEDGQLCKDIKKVGKLKIIKKHVTTSPRTIEKHPLKILTIYAIVTPLFLIGVKPKTLTKIIEKLK